MSEKPRVRRMKFKVKLKPERKLEFLAEMRVLSLRQLSEELDYEYIYLTRILNGDRCMTYNIWGILLSRTTKLYNFFDVIEDEFGITRRKKR